MAEKVSTGGLMTFNYKKGHNPKLDPKRKKEIAEAYEQYYARKKREKKRKILIGIVITAIVILLLIYFLLIR